jgi:hypothetical protein
MQKIWRKIRFDDSIDLFVAIAHASMFQWEFPKLQRNSWGAEAQLLQLFRLILSVSGFVQP